MVVAAHAIKVSRGQAKLSAARAGRPPRRREPAPAERRGWRFGQRPAIFRTRAWERPEM